MAGQLGTVLGGVFYIVDVPIVILRKKYRSACTFAMYITKKSRRFFKIIPDFFVIYIAKGLFSSDRMNFDLCT